MADNKKLISNMDLGSKVSDNSFIRDETTGLLKFDAVKFYADEFLRDMSSGDVCALFIIGINKFDSVKNKISYNIKQNVLCKLTKELSEMFRATDIIGLTKENEFIIFISDPSLTKNAVLNKIEKIRNIKLISDDSKINLTLNIGV